MQMIHSDADPLSYQEQTAQFAPPVISLAQRDNLGQLVHALTEIKEIIAISARAMALIEQGLSTPQQKQSVVEVLSSRELHILTLATSGRNRLQIATSLVQQLLTAVQAPQTRTLTTEEVLLILRWLTHYPQQTISHAEAVQAETLLQQLGGPHAVQQRLQQIAEQWQPRYPLHSETLHKFLAGWERREIVRYIVNQGFYEDSRVYACIKELPSRISKHMRRSQLSPEEHTSTR